MSPRGPTKRGKEIRDWILHQVVFYPQRIVTETARHFQISRQAAWQHISKLCKSGKLTKEGKRTRKIYGLATTRSWDKHVSLKEADEGLEWGQWVSPALNELNDPGVTQNVRAICQHGFTEMLNNAIDHSEGSSALVRLAVTATTVQLSVEDDGVGIFRKIARELELLDEREAIIELSKGKLTTDSSRHSGEGIFFTSRIFDSFTIDSKGLYFDHTPEDDWLIEVDAPTKAGKSSPGTTVTMTVFRNSKREIQSVFDRFSANEDYSFSRTHVPLSLAQYGTDLLVSRSQARRVLARFDKFEEAILDFKNVPRVGQAFADEIFRVHKLANPASKIVVINANQEVRKMISRAQAKLKDLP